MLVDGIRWCMLRGGRRKERERSAEFTSGNRDVEMASQVEERKGDWQQRKKPSMHRTAPTTTVVRIILAVLRADVQVEEGRNASNVGTGREDWYAQPLYSPSHSATEPTTMSDSHTPSRARTTRRPYRSSAPSETRRMNPKISRLSVQRCPLARKYNHAGNDGEGVVVRSPGPQSPLIVLCDKVEAWWMVTHDSC
jgi:hypothetical protein